MNTAKSDKIVEKFRKQKVKFLRKNYQFTGDFEATPEEIFPLLCPTREADWIPGWNADLIFTESGYAEDKCVWRTDENNSNGDGVWTFTGYKENEFIEFVRFRDDLIIHAKIDLLLQDDGTTRITWNVTTTALTEKGNKMVENMPEGSVGRGSVIDMIEYYLKNDDAIGVPTHGH
jgi:hypothetical protein